MKISTALLNKDHVQLVLVVIFDHLPSIFSSSHGRGMSITGVFELEDAKKIVTDLDPTFPLDKIEIRDNWNGK